MANDTAPVTKADLEALESTLRKEITSFKEEVKRYFDVAVENLTGDYRAIFNDRTVDLTNARTNHERRIRRLEERMGIFS